MTSISILRVCSGGYPVREICIPTIDTANLPRHIYLDDVQPEFYATLTGVYTDFHGIVSFEFAEYNKLAPGMVEPFAMSLTQMLAPPPPDRLPPGYIPDEFTPRHMRPVAAEPECLCDIRALMSSGHESGCRWMQWRSKRA